ncbi:MAG: hypothetical protein ABIO55_17390 [Ginsengibacter sp.]
MGKYILIKDIKVFGTQVKTFPEGIGEAFDALIKMLTAEKNRTYYGISEFAKDGSILYYAAAEEIFAGEGKKYDCDTYTIEKGEYLTETINDWRKKTDCIKDVFGEIMQDSQADKSRPCVEWYKTNDEMLCMVKAVPGK